jgi:hypothetical protein
MVAVVGVVSTADVVMAVGGGGSGGTIFFHQAFLFL